MGRGERWTDAENTLLMEMVKQGLSLDDVVKSGRFEGRTPQAIVKQIERLKLNSFVGQNKKSFVGQIGRLKWTDMDFERRIVRVAPEKSSRFRILPISHKLIDMLNNMPRKSDTIWAGLYSLKPNFYKTRKSLAFKLQNPRLKQISLHTFRRWKATMEYHKTKDILHVQQLLGHRDLRNTLIYINLEKALFQNTNDEFHVKVAQSLEEACKLLEVGFEYVTDMNGAKIFRKRK